MKNTNGWLAKNETGGAGGSGIARFLITTPFKNRKKSDEILSKCIELKAVCFKFHI